jgi:2-polyprenyl-3-methyl-5-hydroxy-6-metoxy-1,4-benzoquinol methylase
MSQPADVRPCEVHRLMIMKNRSLLPEVMDQPGLDPPEHARALAGLARINAWSGVSGSLWHPIRRVLKRKESRPARILDIGSGGGDIAIKLWRRAQAAALAVEVHGWDKSDYAIKYATARAAQAGAKVLFFQRDVLAADWGDTYDVVVSSLFLHHFDDQATVHLLERMRFAARRLVLVSDLLRCVPGFIVAVAGTQLLSGSPVVRADGPLSVRRAFTRPEIQMLAQRAGLEKAKITCRWPFRFLLSWSPVHEPGAA